MVREFMVDNLLMTFIHDVVTNTIWAVDSSIFQNGTVMHNPYSGEDIDIDDDDLWEDCIAAGYRPPVKETT